MALTTSNVKQIAVSNFYEGLCSPSDSWRSIFRYSTENVASLRIAALTGIPDPGAWTVSGDLPTATLDSTGAVTMAYSSYGVQVRISKLDAGGDVPGIVAMASAKLGRAVASKRAALAWAHLATAFTAGGTAIADTKALCATDHPTIGTDRSNALTTALDRSAFLSAIAVLRGWRNYQNQQYDLADAPKVLVVPPELEITAKQIIGSPFAMNSAVEAGSASGVFKPPDAQGEANFAGSYSTRVVVSPYLSDASDWFVCVDPSVEAPLTFWDRSVPSFSGNVDEDSQAVKLNADWSSATASGPQPDGIVGSSVS